MSGIVLYDYWRSTASYRVRIALNLAGLSYESRTIDLLAGEHRSAEHINRNPQGFVPVLEIDGLRLTQSLSILEYLDETRAIDLLPNDPVERARIRALAQIIASDTHPVCNLSVVAFATQNASDPDVDKQNWMKHFIRRGLEAYEQLLTVGNFLPCTEGMKPNMADLCLIPQLYNARRWSVEYNDLVRIRDVESVYKDHKAFKDAAPAVS